MVSIRGIYDGQAIRPLEHFNVPSNVEVIITFMDTQIPGKSIDNKTKELLELSGTWEDDRTPEEIIKEIYDCRTSSQKDIDL